MFPFRPGGGRIPPAVNGPARAQVKLAKLVPTGKLQLVRSMVLTGVEARVQRGCKGCSRQVDRIIIRIQAEGDVIRNPKHTIPAANHGLRVPDCRQIQAAGRIAYSPMADCSGSSSGGFPTSNASPRHGEPTVPPHPVTVAVHHCGDQSSSAGRTGPTRPPCNS